MYETRFDFRMKKMAEVLEVKRSRYYTQVKTGNKTKADIQDKYFLKAIQIECIVTRETYGPRCLSKHLKKKGVNIGRERSVRLMRENNIMPKTIKKFQAITNSNHNYPVAENILNRDFTVSAPCNAWMESFFGILKTELVYPEKYRTRRQAKVSIFDYVESFYNRGSLQERLRYNSILQKTMRNLDLRRNRVSAVAGLGQWSRQA